MSRLLIAGLFLIVVAGCSAQATPTPTQPPPTATETAVAPTETAVPPTPTLAPTSVPPTATPTQVPITGTAKATLNVRETPSLTAKSLGTLNKGDSLTLISWSQDKKWLEINYPLGSVTTGWVISTLVQTGANANSLPTATTQVAVETPIVAETKIAGGVTATLTTAARPTAGNTPQPTAASGSPSGSIIFDTFSSGTYKINQVRADGTDLKLLVAGGSEPALSPNGTTLAFHKRSGPGGAGLWVSGIDGSNPKQIANSVNAGYPTWSPDGNNIAYQLPPAGALSGQVHAVTKDGGNDTLIGIGVRPAWQPGAGQFVLLDGCNPNGGSCGSIFTVPAFNGNPNTPTLLVEGANGAWSPNGSQIAFQVTDANGINVYVANHDGSNKRAVTKDAAQSGDPIWSSDGQWIFYRSDKSGVWAVYAIRVDGTSDRKIVDAPVNADNWDFEKLAIAP